MSTGMAGTLGDHVRTRASRGCVAAIVAEPTTRSPRTARPVAGSDPADGLAQPDMNLASVDLGHGRHGGAVRAPRAVQLTEPDGAGPHHRGSTPTSVRTSSSSAEPTVTVRVTGEMSRTYRGRPSGTGSIDVQPAALSHRELVRPLMFAEHVPDRVDDRPGDGTEPAGQETSCVSVRNEADVVSPPWPRPRGRAVRPRAERLP